MEILKHMPDLAHNYPLIPSGMLCNIGSRGDYDANPKLTNEITEPIRAFLDALRQRLDSSWWNIFPDALAGVGVPHAVRGRAA